MDGGTPTKDPPKRGSLFAARAVSEAVAVVPQAASHGEPTTTDGERRPLPGAGNQQVARPRTVARAGSRAQGRFRAVAARPGARIVGRFLSEFPRPPRVVRDMLTGLPFVRSFASRLRGGACLRGKLRSGRVIFFSLRFAA